uniref:Major facilitator superfamily (MFS) profile domain-containing protein n=1 Tax=Globisporangium ultimum (strain ATCC 200006 / CBS 805.95 / DAOM BR144) TaxID=431595 RepID=K3WWJ1_GLOUD
MGRATDDTQQQRGGCLAAVREMLWAPKAMYAISSGGQSALVNFLPVFYEHTAQFTKIQISVLQTLPCICSIVAPPFWGAIADAIRNQRLVHIMCIVTGALLLFSIQYARSSFALTVLFVVLGNFQSAPAGSLLDHAVLDLLSKVGGEYGKQRLFGAVGYGAGAYISGLLVAAAGISWAFNLNLILMLTSLLVLRAIPVVKHGHDDGYAILESADVDGIQKAQANAPPTFMEGLRMLGKKADVLVLLGVVFLMGLMYGVLSSFLTLNLYNLSGNNSQIIGIAIMCETSSELPAFFFSQVIIRKLGTVNVLLLSIAGYALRISYLAIMTNPWGAIPFEFLHGLTFGIAWAACTQYIYTAAPKGCEGTVMGILNAVQNGLGRGAGTLVGGYFYQNYGAPTMWLVTDLGVPLSLLGVAVFAYLKNADELVIEEELLESAELFSPHLADPQGLKSPRHAPPSYDRVDG